MHIMGGGKTGHEGDTSGMWIGRMLWELHLCAYGGSCILVA